MKPLWLRRAVQVFTAGVAIAVGFQFGTSMHQKFGPTPVGNFTVWFGACCIAYLAGVAISKLEE